MKKLKGILFNIILLFSLPLFSQTTTDNYSYNGAPENWVVPPCVTSIDIVIAGAEGGGIGGTDGGNGATVTATIPVNPGDVIEIIVGGQGTCPAAGYNGGGAGFASTNGNTNYNSCGGGGSTDISINGIIVAVASGGGGAGGGSVTTNNGGNGGCATGTAGVNTFGAGGTGGTLASGGNGGAPWAGTPPGGQNGSLGQGGNGGLWQTASGGGGGGGYYGGGGGGNDGCCTGANGGGGGGGGSSLTPGGGNCSSGVNTGDGYASITFTPAIPIGGIITAIPTTICSGETVDLSLAGYTGTLQWQSAPTSVGPFVNVVGEINDTYTTGTLTSDVCYRVEVTSCGTVAYSDTSCITVNPIPNINGGLDVTVCDGELVTLTANNPDGASLSWDGGVIDGTPFTPPLGTTTYTITATLLGCDSTDQVDVIVNPFPVIGAGLDQEECDGILITVTANNPNGAIISWDGGITDGTPFTPPLGITTYTVTGDLLGCITTDNMDVTINPLPVIGAGSDITICQDEIVTVNGTGVGAGGTYVWDNGITNGTPFTPTDTTTYTVVGTDVNGCQGTDDMTVNVIFNPVVSFTADTLIGCEPFSVTFTNLSTPNGSDCIWDFGDGNFGSGCGTVSHTYDNDGIYNVGLTVIIPGGCESSTMYNSYIEVANQPIASFSVLDPTVTVIDPGVVFNNSSLNSDTYIWTFGDGSPNSGEEDPIHLYPEDPNVSYTVILYAENYLGCYDSTTKIIIVDDIIIFYIPNAFTPNNDNNQIFIPIVYSGVDIYNYHFTVFNRWGEIIFESYDPTGGWDGTYGDSGTVTDGVYVWQLDFLETMSDKRHQHYGHVTVLK